ncbi:MAG: Rne/Rng family ribonuclease [Clostridia bacterium]|nr:Rne/Rng family ribonuclease [Clostridia bacterium]
MVKDVLVDVGVGEIRLALLENGELSEVYIESHEDGTLVGNIYRGKVERVLPGMQSAFIDIGLDKNAFLYVKDVLPLQYDEDGDVLPHGEGLPDISELLSQGQEITVQVIKEPTGNKGPRVTTRISLPGRYTVLMPHSAAIGVSKKMESVEERKRLREIAQAVKPENAGLIIRTAAENLTEDKLVEDIQSLKLLWQGIVKKEQRGAVPRLLYSEPGIIAHAVREYLTADVHRFILNDRTEYDKVLALLDDAAPGLKMKVEYFSKSYDMFEFYHVESAITEALSRKVWLKSGAYLVFDRTEALSVIDVNSGKYVGKTNLEDTALKINLEAAKTIARQLRLRDLSGIIIVDFIDMHQKEHREQVVQALKEYVKADRTQTTVVGMTSLGLVEITRKKVRQPLYKSLTIDCRSCQGAGYKISPVTIARRIEKRIALHMAETLSEFVEAVVHPEILKVLEGQELENIEKLKARYSCSLKLTGSYEVDYDEVSIKKALL